MAIKYNHKAFLANIEKRELRRKNWAQAVTLLQDIRVYFTYDLPGSFRYLLTFADSLLRILQHKNFRCPGYHHIYISIGETMEGAIARASELEPWYRFGVAVLPKKNLLSCPKEKREELFLTAIGNGLYDIAELDKLDKEAIREALEQAKIWGAVHEKIISQNQNRKYNFRVIAVPVVGKTTDAIYFSLIDREEQQEYRWKFGNLAALEAALWFFKINVTNKLVRTKPRAHMQLVLKGKKNELELSVEAIKSGKGRIKLKDTKVPVEPWMIELEKKLKWKQ